ncbi:MAG: hypothetical protein D6719_05120 [Candidatus Dadabacteria bacterium]|nr:MAG: hypothetical protein D6719_05120 [Candidatus Dadabacteria bacterium]
MEANEGNAVMSDRPKSLSEKIEKTSENPELKNGKARRGRNKKYVVDLRIHSPASLGYMKIEGIDTAPALVRLAKVKGLDVIAVTDFYSGNFIDPMVEAARESDLTVIPGVVIRCAIKSCNDVVLLCLFPEEYGTEDVEHFMLELGIPRSSFGDERYTVDMELSEILNVLEKHGGEAMPSRMDKTPYRMGAIPELVEKYGFRAFDLAYADSASFFKKNWPRTKFQLFSFSNANSLAQVGSRSAKIKLSTPGFEGLKKVVSRVTAASA